MIHNSGFLKGLGYRYGDFDAEHGAQVLLDAHVRHDDELPHQACLAAELFARLSPEALANINLHESLLCAGAST